VNPEVKRAVSNKRVAMLATALEAPSSSAFSFKALTMGDLGEISKVFLEAMYELIEVSMLVLDEPNLL
jgi:hypothetical protein